VQGDGFSFETTPNARKLTRTLSPNNASTFMNDLRVPVGFLACRG
jgi:hypothetical protein